MPWQFNNVPPEINLTLWTSFLIPTFPLQKSSKLRRRSSLIILTSGQENVLETTENKFSAYKISFISTVSKVYFILTESKYLQKKIQLHHTYLYFKQWKIDFLVFLFYFIFYKINTKSN